MAMAAMAAKERRPHHLPLVLVLALSVALDLALPAGAAGNDVISSTKAESEHGLIQLDQDIEDAADTSDQSRQSRPHKNIDYDAYANDSED
ncbi:GL18064 [Drosophila persimilis]|uniref:GL18064 n=1 Tax=Drosophila persimilis TaxID=7234 RepID=B4HAK0_DROPE|nr:GL18064 [Drosophila persimilis]